LIAGGFEIIGVIASPRIDWEAMIIEYLSK
jgi:hypothetical protein